MRSISPCSAPFFEDAVILRAKIGRAAAVGLVEGHLVTAVFARYGAEAISVISLRRASVKERKLHGRERHKGI
jgi:uncharacterized DUF497 family protein